MECIAFQACRGVPTSNKPITLSSRSSSIFYGLSIKDSQHLFIDILLFLFNHSRCCARDCKLKHPTYISTSRILTGKNLVRMPLKVREFAILSPRHNRRWKLNWSRCAIPCLMGTALSENEDKLILHKCQGIIIRCISFKMIPVSDELFPYRIRSCTILGRLCAKEFRQCSIVLSVGCNPLHLEWVDGWIAPLAEIL